MGMRKYRSCCPFYVPSALEGYSHQGQLYGVPTVNEGIFTWYHKDAIEEAGLTPPAEIENDPDQWNWDTFLEYAKALNIGEGFRRERFGAIATSAPWHQQHFRVVGQPDVCQRRTATGRARRRGADRLYRGGRGHPVGRRSDLGA